jgi:hypothetical protein
MSAVYFPNGTTAGVAKIEGSAAYKNEMLRLLYEAPRRFIDESPSGYFNMEAGYAEFIPDLPATRVPAPSPVPEESSSTWAESTQNYLQNHIPWLYAPNLKKQPLEQMFRDLKTATETFLQHEIHHAEVSTPVNFSPGAIIDAPLNRIGLFHTQKSASDAAFAATRANGVGNDSSPDGYGGLILCVDYSRSGLLVTL